MFLPFQLPQNDKDTDNSISTFICVYNIFTINYRGKSLRVQIEAIIRTVTQAILSGCKTIEQSVCCLYYTYEVFNNTPHERTGALEFNKPREQIEFGNELSTADSRQGISQVNGKSNACFEMLGSQYFCVRKLRG